MRDGARILLRIQRRSFAPLFVGQALAIPLLAAAPLLGGARPLFGAAIGVAVAGSLASIWILLRALSIRRKAFQLSGRLCDDCLYPMPPAGLAAGSGAICPECGNDLSQAQKRWDISLNQGIPRFSSAGPAPPADPSAGLTRPSAPPTVGDRRRDRP